MEVRIKVKVPTERVRHDHDHQASAISVFGPLVGDGCARGGQVIQQAAVFAQGGPENGGHCKDDAGILDVWKRRPHLALPKDRRTVPAARTRP